MGRQGAVHARGVLQDARDQGRVQAWCGDGARGWTWHHARKLKEKRGPGCQLPYQQELSDAL